MNEVRCCLERNQGSMAKLLHLTEVPDMKATDEEIETLDLLRLEPLEGEKQMYWALQTGDDSSTRQVLPSWISQPISLNLFRWLEQNQKWCDRIEVRMREGKNLEPKKQLEYERWCSESGHVNLLFSKKTCKQVTSVRSNADVNKLKQFLFSIHVRFSSDPEGLCLKTAAGKEQRLVILRGQPVEQTTFPDVLDAGFTEEAWSIVVPMIWMRATKKTKT